MNNSDFTYILQHPQAVRHQQTDKIKLIIDEFPYFQSARALYLKGLKKQESFIYNQELKITASYTTDRSILFDFITSETFIQNEISQFIKQNTAQLKDADSITEDDSVNKSATIDFILDDSKLIENPSKETKNQQASATKILNLGRPLQFDKKETHSFNEWLKLTHIKPIKREDTKPKEMLKQIDFSQTEKAKKFDLIDMFIQKNPKINPSKSISSKNNLAKAQMIQPEALMTETLARIYLEQKNYKKAIQSYKILSLKYPEKSSFFANQIKAVEQLQE